MSRLVLALGSPMALAVSQLRFLKLRRANPHPFGLAGSPELAPKMLGDESWSGSHSVSWITLSYGNMLDTSSQLIEVSTCMSEADCYLAPLENIIMRAEQRDNAIRRHDWSNITAVFEPDRILSAPSGPFSRSNRNIVINGENSIAEVVSYKDYESLRFRRGQEVVTAVSRHRLPEPLHFETVNDLKPYFDGLTRFYLSWLRIWPES